MGIDTMTVQFLCCAKSLGADFSQTMMLGRQTISAPPEEYAPLLSMVGISNQALSCLSKGCFAEPLFALLGAHSIRSLDISNWEKATDIHDMNEPLPPSLSGSFSVVFDGGSIEHVFNAVQAFKNSMEMLRVGGHFIQVNAANNFLGHGFWQFSPELIFRAFSPENGFKVEAVFLFVVPSGPWYKLYDPASYGMRAELSTTGPTFICTVAQRVSAVSIFSRSPQQSDYVAVWNQASIRRPDRPLYEQISVDNLIRGQF